MWWLNTIRTGGLRKKEFILRMVPEGESPLWHGGGVAASSRRGVRRGKLRDHLFYSTLEVAPGYELWRPGASAVFPSAGPPAPKCPPPAPSAGDQVFTRLSLGDGVFPIYPISFWLGCA